MISESIFDDIHVSLQKKILNMVIPILRHFYSFVSNWSFASHIKPHVIHPTKCDVIDDVKLFPTIYRKMYCSKILTLSNQAPRKKSKYIRILTYILCSCTISNILTTNGFDHDFRSDVIMTSVYFNNWRLKSYVSFDLKTNSLKFNKSNNTGTRM